MPRAIGIAARVMLALAYPVLAHAASVTANGMYAATALWVVVAFVLVSPIEQGRWWAWLALIGSAAAIPLLAASRWAMAPVLLMPVVFLAGACWLFARTLLRGRTPLIVRMIEVIEDDADGPLAVRLRRYGTGLTWVWALALGALALFNAVLALIAQPSGLLASAGVSSPLHITDVQWAWLANWVNYTVMAVLMVGEFQFRKVSFPGRYRNALQFVNQLRRVTLAQWQQILR